ncbi:SAM-dependent methyltransferase [Actinomadura kijaniata]|uniref:SAM-dependent methyltransferase n=1 Tax=Actinomadura kijaniata TaxID=46161 RepID=UPI001FDFACF9|nr:SAM-dependent methyltransferase [Actinomadura kijaniata]
MAGVEIAAMQAGEKTLSAVDPQTPNVPRMYDYLLGGKDNYAVDREAVAEVVRHAPDTPFMARENRAFLRRAVRFLAQSGIRQFIDLGSGLPTQGNVHEIAHQVAPDARVVYVDVEPIVLTHGRALLANKPEVTVIQGDIRRIDEILGDPELGRLIDFDQPVAVLMLAVLHFIDDEYDPPGIVARIRAAMAPGSYLAVSHVTGDFDTDSRVQDAAAAYEKATNQITLRSRAQVLRLFDDLELVEPGLTTLSMWRPDPGATVPLGAERQWCYAGVGHKAEAPGGL